MSAVFRRGGMPAGRRRGKTRGFVIADSAGGIAALFPASDIAAGQQRATVGGLSLAGRLSVAVYLLFALIVAVNALVRPIADWDMLAYTAAVFERQGEADPVRLHARSYALVQSRIRPEQFHELTTNGRYRTVQAADPAAFVSMLPMYQVKGGYVRLVSALSRLGDPVVAMRAVSLMSMTALMAALFWAFWRLGELRLIGLLTPLMAVLRFPDLASLCSPDPLGAALLVSAAAVILVNGSPRPPAVALGLMVLAVLFRPDMLVAAGGLPVALVAGAALAGWLAGKRPVAALIEGVRAVGSWPWAAAAAAFGAYQLAKIGVSHPGWWPHFIFSIHQQQDSMAGFQPAFDWRIYLSAQARVANRLLSEQVWPWAMLALVLAGLIGARLKAFGPLLLGMVFLVAGVQATRLVAFPLPDSRIAAANLLTAALLAAAYVARNRPR
jgi:hypothetical protein